MPKASSSEVVAGAREESASKRSARLDLFGFVPFRLNRLAAEVSSALSVEYAARYGLDIPEWRVLATLGFRHDACSAQYIAQCTRTHKSTISRAVTSLMKRQIVERVENEDDRREFRLRLTRKGEMNRAWDEWVDTKNPPMRACIGVDLEPPHIVEMVVTAVK